MRTTRTEMRKKKRFSFPHWWTMNRFKGLWPEGGCVLVLVKWANSTNRWGFVWLVSAAYFTLTVVNYNEYKRHLWDSCDDVFEYRAWPPVLYRVSLPVFIRPLLPYGHNRGTVFSRKELLSSIGPQGRKWAFSDYLKWIRTNCNKSCRRVTWRKSVSLIQSFHVDEIDHVLWMARVNRGHQRRVHCPSC